MVRISAGVEVNGTFLVIATSLFAASALADDALPAAPQPGDCVTFREGGSGWLLKAPTYWLRGVIAGVSRERRMAKVCPRIGKPVSAYTRVDQLRMAAATPCVEHDSEVGEVDVLRLQVSVEAWETPWSYQHGNVGWLFRGQFLEQTLKHGQVIDMDAGWLEPCEAGS
ncbi:MAG: hypothetical protein KBE22_09865 [Candidatus Accumulibacter sp.]|nr:hypothetical protein [Accumulibacter sp.]